MSTLEATAVPAGTDDGPAPSRDIARVLGLALALAVVACLALLAVVVPGQNAMPRDVPIGLAGPQESVSQLQDVLTSAQPGAYDVRTFENGEALHAATEDREIYGGLVLDQAAPAVVIATGASPMLANFLSSLGGQMGLTDVTDVAQTTTTDPAATGVTVAVVLAALTSLTGAVGLRLLARGRPAAQAVGAAALSVVLGLAISGALTALGSVEGEFWGVAGAVALGVLASTAIALGLMALLGTAVGTALDLVLLTLPGIGLAGMTYAPEMLPAGWGTLGRFLPPGATGAMVQSGAYFGGSGSLRPASVLLGWIVLGLVLLALGTLRRRRAGARAALLEAALAAEAEADAEEAAEEHHRSGGADARSDAGVGGGAGAPAHSLSPSDAHGDAALPDRAGPGDAASDAHGDAALPDRTGPGDAASPDRVGPGEDAVRERP